ncbi:MAG: LpqN/LpqT family lipoprotein [Mycobacterium sp.]
MRLRGFAAAMSLVVLLAGCDTKPTDYRAVWSSTSATPTTTTEAPVPFSQYLQDKGVDGEPMTPKTLTGLTVSMPHPKGWVVVTDENQPSAFEIIRKTAVDTFQPTAMLFVFKLTGNNFDPDDALKHAYDMPGAIQEPFNGMPSAKIEATYVDATGQQLHRYNRIVIATARTPANQRYLIQFSVTTLADPSQESDPDVLTIIKGFTIAVR